MRGISRKVLVNFYLVTPLFAILATLLREVEGHEFFCDDWGIHQGLASLENLTGEALLFS